MKANNGFLKATIGLLLLAVGSSTHAITFSVANQNVLLAEANGLVGQQGSLGFTAQTKNSLFSPFLLLVQVNKQAINFRFPPSADINQFYPLGGQPITSLLFSLPSNVLAVSISNESLFLNGAVFSVPETSTLALMGIGLLGVSLSRHRRSTPSALLSSQAMP